MKHGGRMVASSDGRHFMVCDYISHASAFVVT